MKDTLVFDVRNIKDGDFNFHEVEIHTSQLELDFEDVEFLSPVRASVQLLRHGEDNVYVKAEVSTDIEMQCRRCLELFKTDIATTFEVQFTPNSSTEQIESEDFEDGERHYDGETFNISEDTWRALVIQIPIWPLCSQMCEGLCYTCGTNLNEECCTCKDIGDMDEEDSNLTSPFAALPQLLETAKLDSKTKPKNSKERVSKNGSSKT